MALVRADVNGNISVSSDWMWLLNARLHHIDHRPSLCRFLVASVPRHCQWHRIASELLILSVGKAARIGLLSTPLSLVAEMGTHCYTSSVLLESSLSFSPETGRSLQEGHCPLRIVLRDCEEGC